MKKIFNILILGALILTSSSCKKFLDVNQNPNNPTDATPELILPQAIVTATSSTTSYDNFGAWTGGYKANAGGYGGWGTVWTYNFTNTDYNAMWTSAFSGINQLNVVINKTDATGTYKYFNAIARIMKSYLYVRLVDQYGDVPYSEAGLALNDLNPKYDNYADVYKACFAELNAAIAIFDSPFTANTFIPVTSGQDPLFGGSGSTTALSAANVTKWKQFANTIKLKMVVRARVAQAAWAATAKASLPTAAAGYIVDDAIVQPGYSAANANQFNPQYAAYAWTNTGVAVGQGLSNIPTPWILSFYNGTTFTDPVRGQAMYAGFGVSQTQTVLNAPLVFTGPATNQLGYDTEPLKRGQNGSWWYSGVNATGAARLTGTGANSATSVGGVLKGAAMGQPLMLHAEAKFLLAEASLTSTNILPALAGSTQSLYEAGIAASFNYLYKNSSNVYFNATPAVTLAANYITANPHTYPGKSSATPAKAVVDITKAVDDDERLMAIITQKYIAVNMIHSEEGFNEYRRTGYPLVVNGSTDATKTFASLKSSSPSNDKLPKRVGYPNVELQVNTENVPKGINPQTTKIWYDQRP